ncbi:hypothetical protein [Paraburkholderia sp.]|uniref:hypothetical protein n=1 Tax=Paraburkholderia sp. TaxID=1926495 RepID=UPI0039E3B9EE
MDMVLVLPVICIIVLAVLALVVKMVNDKAQSDDDDFPPTGASPVSDDVIAAGTVCAMIASASMVHS